MTIVINPPCLAFKSYEQYISELLAWREVTEISKEKQGIVIALSLPENDKHRIREKVFSEVSLEDLKNTDGLDNLIRFLDTHLKKDELTDSIEKFEAFEDFKRSEGQSMTEFITSFDSKYRKIEKLNMKLPPETLAFKLIRKANISKEEKLLVLTGMNYGNKETLYEEAKTSLKKFKGDMAEQSSSFWSGGQIKPAFSEKYEEALLGAGYVEQGKKEMTVKSGHTNKNGYTEVGRIGGGAILKQKRRNRLGANGRPLLCKSCGSYRHLVAECPDSWENMDRVKFYETSNETDCAEDHHLVLFTKHEKGGTVKLGIDDRHYAVLDSACSSSVCGEKWLYCYIDALSKSDRKKVKHRVSRKTFKFGGGSRLKSKGEYWLPAVIAGEEVTIKTDVVKSDIPLLLSQKAMKTAGVKIDLETDTANIFGKDIVLNVTSSGHYCVPIGRTEAVSAKLVAITEHEVMADTNEKGTELHSGEQCIPSKLRRQESHKQGTTVDMQTEVNRNIKEAFPDEQTSKSGNKAFHHKRVKKQHLAVSDELHANIEERLPMRQKEQQDLMHAMTVRVSAVSTECKLKQLKLQRRETASNTVVCGVTNGSYSRRRSQYNTTEEDTTDTPTNNDAVAIQQQHE